jgi:hypothetical protein
VSLLRAGEVGHEQTLERAPLELGRSFEQPRSPARTARGCRVRRSRESPLATPSSPRCLRREPRSVRLAHELHAGAMTCPPMASGSGRRLPQRADRLPTSSRPRTNSPERPSAPTVRWMRGRERRRARAGRELDVERFVDARIARAQRMRRCASESRARQLERALRAARRELNADHDCDAQRNAEHRQRELRWVAGEVARARSGEHAHGTGFRARSVSRPSCTSARGRPARATRASA